jgi:hypothetical protein
LAYCRSLVAGFVNPVYDDAQEAPNGSEASEAPKQAEAQAVAPEVEAPKEAELPVEAQLVCAVSLLSVVCTECRFQVDHASA